MDIQKEREAFEKECRLLCYKGNMVMSNLGSFYNNEQTNWMWQMWLSSKSKAVPKGFTVVPIEITPKQIEAYMKGKVFPASISEHRKFVERLSKDYKAMIEAQE